MRKASYPCALYRALRSVADPAIAKEGLTVRIGTDANIGSFGTRSEVVTLGIVSWKSLTARLGFEKNFDRGTTDRAAMLEMKKLGSNALNAHSIYVGTSYAH